MKAGASLMSRRQLNFAKRNFSLLVPVQGKADVPAEIQSSPVTDKFFADLEASYAEFNEQCKNELQVMN